MTTVSLKNVSKSYGNNEVVHGIDLDIHDSELVVLVGPSGCGKTTTLRMIAGLEEITSGELHINGNYMNNAPPSKRNIAMVFQNYALYPHMSVYENMAFSLKIAKAPKKVIEEKVMGVAKVLGLTEYLERKPKALSGGQRQRVAMGRAMVKEAGVFLFDEPLSNLDAQLRSEMRTELKRRHFELKKTTIYVTHDQIEAMTLADRIVIMRDGYIEQIGTPLEVFERPANKFVASFIGSPGMNFFEMLVHQGEHGTMMGDSSNTFRLPIPDSKRESVRPGKKIIFGILPSDVFISDPSDNIPGHWKHDAHVDVVEPLGKNALIYLTIGPNKFVGEIMGRSLPKPGEKVNLSFNLNHLHLFDPSTEKSIVY